MAINYIDFERLRVIWNVRPFVKLYFKGKAIYDVCYIERVYVAESNTQVLFAKLQFSDGTYGSWRSDRDERPTTEAPRKCIKHINLQLLEDIDHGS